MRHSESPATAKEDVTVDSNQAREPTPETSRTPESPESQSNEIPPQLRRKSAQHEFEMDDSALLSTHRARSRGSSSIRSVASRAGSKSDSLLRKQMFAGVARHTVGLILLLAVVFLWTLSNFLGSSIFADSSYAKPFFLTYLNTSIFLSAMVPTLIKWTMRQWRNGTLKTELRRLLSFRTIQALFGKQDDSDVTSDDHNEESEAFMKAHRQTLTSSGSSSASNTVTSNSNSVRDDTNAYLGLVPTARLSFAFCILWFGANYFAMACLQHTTVASATILTSTSSIWTLLIGSLTRTERFTWRKLCGVLGSLAGIMLISHVDFSSPSKPSSATPTPPSAASSNGEVRRALEVFPDKPATELALGDALALLSATIYGFYTITLKRSTIKADPLELHMPTFFGLVGLFNIFLLLPLFPILHFTRIEAFEWPPTSHIWMILIVNSISSFASDIMWAYAMVFTSPLIVTVGLSLTIPLSLVGEMIVQARYEGWMYWVGAMIVVGSFVFVEREEVKEEEQAHDDATLRHVEEGLPVSEEVRPSAGQSTSHRGTRVRHELYDNDNNNDDNDDDLADLMGGSDDEDDARRDRLQQEMDGIVH